MSDRLNYTARDRSCLGLYICGLYTCSRSVASHFGSTSVNCLLFGRIEAPLVDEITQFVRSMGWNVRVMHSLNEDTEFLTSQHNDVIVLTDIHEGLFEFVYQLRNDRPRLAPMLALFDREPAFPLERLLNAGIDDMLVRPWTTDVLTHRFSIMARRKTERDRQHTTEQALIASEVKTSTILRTTVDGIIIIDEGGGIESFNTAAESIFGYTANEVIGANISMLMPSPFREDHTGYIKRYEASGHSKIIGRGREVSGLRKNGEIFPMELAVSAMHLNGVSHYTGIVRDITVRRQLEKRMFSIQESEYRRVGEDLHDGLGQMITGMGLLAQNLVNSLRQQNIPESQVAEELMMLLKEADEHTRTLTRTLIPVEVEQGGLNAALIRLVAHIEFLYKVPCQLERHGTLPLLDIYQKTHMYRIIQEGMTNAARHGQATSIRLSLAGSPQRIRARVQDNGVGFDPDNASLQTGMGLPIMRHRANAIGATLEIRPDTRQGTILTCTLPIQQPGISPNSSVSRYAS